MSDTLQRLQDKLHAVLGSFIHDPPRSDFQRGYLAAVEEIASVAEVEVPQEVLQWERR